MRVVVVELRATGMKLSAEEIAAAPPVEGELFVEPGVAYLCAGPRPSEWPEHGRALPPLYGARLRRLRGDRMVIVGTYHRDAIEVHVTQPQAWWCKRID